MSSRDLSPAASGVRVARAPLALLDLHNWLIEATLYPANAHSFAMALLAEEACS